MADKTGIEWTDATWNPLAGCSLVSPGCTNCYAMSHANRLLDKPGSHYEGTTKKVNGKAVWTGKIAKAPDHIMTQPLRWSRPRMVFVNSMYDLFHEDVPGEWIDEVFAIMALCPQHTFQILTKRPNRMRDYAEDLERRAAENECINAGEYLLCHCISDDMWPRARDSKVNWPLENVWLGVSIEDQRRANERIATLLNTPSAVRFLSMEPLVSGVDLNALENTAIKDPEKQTKVHETCLYTIADRPAILPAHDTNKIDWVIVGGESGTGARPMHPDWVRYLRDQCVTAGVPFFFKQWGQYAPGEVIGPDGKFKAVSCDGPWSSSPIWSATDDTWMDEADHGPLMYSVGKKKAGNTLDGETWQQMPERKV